MKLIKMLAMKSRVICGVAALLLLLSTSAMAGFIDFEGDTLGPKANGFTSVGDAGVHFFDTIGTDLRVHPDQTVVTQNLQAPIDDASRIKIVFDTDKSSLNLFFGNDDACCSAPGDRAWLEVFSGATSVGLTSVVMNRNDLIDQSIDISAASFDSALFWYGSAGGTPIALIEAIDNISFTDAVPEPASLALLSLGLAGLGFSRRKQA